MVFHKIFMVLFLCFYSLSVQALSPAPPEQRFIYAFDKNGDHKLNLKEFLAVQKSSVDGLDSNQKFLVEGLDWDFPVTQSSFKKLDLNKDDFLDYKDELPICYSKEFSEYALCLSNREQK